MKRVMDQGIDLSDVRGQARAKRALEIAAAGGHSLLLVGPLGSGKTMLARRLATIMPALSQEEASEIVSVYDRAGLVSDRTQPPWNEPEKHLARPFRAPHHTVSTAGMLGGGQRPRPGEVSLAHHGVLFLDELPEYRFSTLSELAGVLYVGSAPVYSRTDRIVFPAMPLLCAAANSCPCGRDGWNGQPCPCNDAGRAAYRQRLRKIVDALRLELIVMVEQPRFDCQGDEPTESSADVRERVTKARQCAPQQPGTDVLRRVATTIARLAGERLPSAQHYAEAASLTGPALGLEDGRCA